MLDTASQALTSLQNQQAAHKTSTEEAQFQCQNSQLLEQITRYSSECSDYEPVQKWS